MVRDADRRTAKYTAKINGDVIKNRIDALKESMVEQVTNRFATLVQKEEATKSLLVGWGVSTIQVPFYLSYSREIWGITLKHSGAIAEHEACIATEKWWHTYRGLDPYYLMTICNDVYSIDVSACTA